MSLFNKEVSDFELREDLPPAAGNAKDAILIHQTTPERISTQRSAKRL